MLSPLGPVPARRLGQGLTLSTVVDCKAQLDPVLSLQKETVQTRERQMVQDYIMIAGREREREGGGDVGRRRRRISSGIWIMCPLVSRMRRRRAETDSITFSLSPLVLISPLIMAATKRLAKVSTMSLCVCSFTTEVGIRRDKEVRTKGL